MLAVKGRTNSADFLICIGKEDAGEPAHKLVRSIANPGRRGKLMNMLMSC